MSDTSVFSISRETRNYKAHSRANPRVRAVSRDCYYSLLPRETTYMHNARVAQGRRRKGVRARVCPVVARAGTRDSRVFSTRLPARMLSITVGNLPRYISTIRYDTERNVGTRARAAFTGANSVGDRQSARFIERVYAPFGLLPVNSLFHTVRRPHYVHPVCVALAPRSRAGNRREFNFSLSRNEFLRHRARREGERPFSRFVPLLLFILELMYRALCKFGYLLAPMWFRVFRSTLISSNITRADVGGAQRDARA